MPSPLFIGPDYFFDSGTQLISEDNAFFDCGMGVGVALLAPIVSSTTLHGSTRRCCM